MEHLLDASQITKSHDGNPVLRGVSFHVAEGEVLGIVGENGVGKSTLMHILAGDYTPDTGHMRLEGVDYAPQSPEDAQRAGVGIIRQHFEVDPALTVAQAVYRTGFQKDRPHEDLRRQAAMLLREIGSDLSPDARMGDLLRSDHAIVEAVRMLAEDAQVVIMDEVGTTFNLREISDLHFITSRLSAQGRAVLYISHRLHEIKSISDRIAVLKDGRIATILTPRHVSTDDIAQAMLTRSVDLTRTDHTTDEIVLEVGNLSTADGAVAEASFHLRRGEVLGLSGDKQAGMYGVAGSLVGQVPHRADVLRVMGQDRAIETPQDAAVLRIGYFSDDDDEMGLSSSETIARSMMAGGWTEGADFETEVTALREIIENIQRLAVRSRSITAGVDTLSGGDRQKLALTRWMAEDRDILILNEPTRGLDVGARAQIRDILAEHTAAGRSAIVVSSDPGDLMGWCNRIVLMRRGRVDDELRPEYDARRLELALGGDGGGPQRAL